MTDTENAPQQPSDPPPNGVLIFLSEDGTPAYATVGTGLPEYSAPLVLRKVANVLEDNLLR